MLAKMQKLKLKIKKRTTENAMPKTKYMAYGDMNEILKV